MISLNPLKISKQTIEQPLKYIKLFVKQNKRVLIIVILLIFLIEKNNELFFRNK